MNVVQSLNSPFFPPHIGAEPGRAKTRVQDNLHAHAKNEPIKNCSAVVDESSYLLSSKCCAIPFSARVLKKFFFGVDIVVKNIFFGVDIVVKNKLICALSWSVLLSTTTTRNFSFPEHFFRIVSAF